MAEIIEEIPIADVAEEAAPTTAVAAEVAEEVEAEAPAPKKSRGRPPGAKNKPKAAPAAPKEAEPKPKAKRAPRKVAQVEEEEESEEEAPPPPKKKRAPVRQMSQDSLQPEPPDTRQIAAEVLHLLSNRHVERAQAKRDKYRSWFQ